MPKKTHDDLDASLQDILQRCAALESFVSDSRSLFARGDHLVVSRGLYSHHGIYAGDDHVIHYSGLSDGLTAGPVCFDTMATFSQGGEVTVRKYSAAEYTGAEVVRRAESRLGEDRYDVHSNNCEDFCTWAVTGSHGSAQVDFVEDVLRHVLPAAGVIARAREHLARETPGDSGSSFSSATVSTAGTAAAMTVMPVLAPLFAAKGLVKLFSK